MNHIKNNRNNGSENKRVEGKTLISSSCLKEKEEGKIHASGGINMRNEKTTYPPPHWGELICLDSRTNIKKNDVGFALKEKKQTRQNQPKNSLKDYAVVAFRRGFLLSIVLIFGLINQFLSLTERLVQSIARPYPRLRNKF